MFKKIILVLIVFGSLILLSNKGGRNQESTGAPHENNKFACAECHSGGTFTPELEVVLKDQNNTKVDQYIAGNEYTIEMKITSSTGKPTYYGFQAVMVDQNQNQAGSFLSLGDKVRKLTLSERTYLMQISPRPDGLFTAKWKATPEDTATIYIAGLAANGNNGTGGDKTKVASFTFTKANITAAGELADKYSKLLQYNLVTEDLIFKKKVTNVAIYNLNGNAISHDQPNYNLSSLSPGLYVVQYKCDGVIHVEKIIKL